MGVVTKNVYVLYHANCSDGFCAAWIARGVLPKDTVFIPVHYAQDPPIIPLHSHLYILDFSYTKEQILKWWTPGPDRVDKLVLLDHHKTATEELGPNGIKIDEICVSQGFDCPEIVLDMSKSGGRLAWEYWHGTDPSPGLVDYTEDRDMWWWRLPSSKEVNAALRSYQLDFILWDIWGQHDANRLCEIFEEPGKAILRSERQIVENHVKNAREGELAGYKILYVNATVLFSEIAGELAKNRPFGACYFDRQDGKRQWSLRSSPSGVDVSAIAKQFGGGGHKHAAGFEIAFEEDQPVYAVGPKISELVDIEYVGLESDG